jgi:hypothetical protein
MTLNRQIFNHQGLFIGPAPATGYHFLNMSGILNNDVHSSFTNYNLVRSLPRVQGLSYSIDFPRTELRQLGTWGTVAYPNITYPEVNLNFSYLQAGILNELRMGFYANYHQTVGHNSGISYYSDNFKVCCISGFVTRELGFESATDVDFPYTYRDKRNLFVAINQEGKDINHVNSGNQLIYQNIDVLGFGNCYLNSYSARGGVGELPVVNCGYTAENVIYYTSASGIHIPAIEPKYLTQYTGTLFKIPSTFEGDDLVSVLLPGDTSLNIYSIDNRTGLSIYGTGLDERGNLAVRSEELEFWSKSSLEVFVTGNLIANPVNKEFTADFVGTNTGVATSRSLSLSFPAVSGIGYEYSLWAKAGNTGRFSMGIYNLPAAQWLNFITVDLTQGQIINVTQTASLYQSIVSGDDGWFKCTVAATAPSGMITRFYIYPGSFALSNYNTLYFWGAHLRETTWPTEYIQTYNVGITGKTYETNISDLGINFTNLNVQNYAIDLQLNRQPLTSLTHRLPIDRKITFPVYVNSNFSVLCNTNQTGHLRSAFFKDRDYFLTFKLQNPARNGVGVQYDFRRAKLTNLSFADTIGENKIANLGFVTEITPDNFDRGFFMSGMANVQDLYNFVSSLLIDGGADDGDYLLLEDGGRIMTESQSFLY